MQASSLKLDLCTFHSALDSSKSQGHTFFRREKDFSKTAQKLSTFAGRAPKCWYRIILRFKLRKKKNLSLFSPATRSSNKFWCSKIQTSSDINCMTLSLEPQKRHVLNNIRNPKLIWKIVERIPPESQATGRKPPMSSVLSLCSLKLYTRTSATWNSAPFELVAWPHCLIGASRPKSRPTCWTTEVFPVPVSPGLGSVNFGQFPVETSHEDATNIPFKVKY